MQELNIRYAFILLPLMYIILPFILTGNFLLLGGITVSAFIFGAIIFIIISNLNIGGGAATVNVKVGQSAEGGYSLFVIVMGGIFYLGAQVVPYIMPIITGFLNGFITVINVIGSIFSFSLPIMSTDVLTSLNGSDGIPISNFYDLSVSFDGISIFLALNAIMGMLFILGLYFMIASRGQ